MNGESIEASVCQIGATGIIISRRAPGTTGDDKNMSSPSRSWTTSLKNTCAPELDMDEAVDDVAALPAAAAQAVHMLL